MRAKEPGPSGRISLGQGLHHLRPRVRTKARSGDAPDPGLIRADLALAPAIPPDQLPDPRRHLGGVRAARVVRIVVGDQGGAGEAPPEGAGEAGGTDDAGTSCHAAGENVRRGDLAARC